MGALLLQRGLLLVGLCVALLAVGFSYSSASSLSTKTSSAVVFGRTECLDCAENNIKSQHAFEGLYVAIKCKISNGIYETIVAGKLNKKGAFKAQLPEQVVGHDGKLKHECVAQVHDVSNSPCPADKDSKLVLKHTKGGVNTFAVTGKIPFSSATCASAFSWPHHKFPAKPKLHPVYKPLHPPVSFPPKPYFPPKSPPIYHKPLPPIFKKPLPPIPYHKPHPSVPKFPPIPHKPLPPIFKKPLPPIPYHKPHPSLPKFPPIPHKPLPPIFKKPFHKDHPFYKKPFPKYPPSP
ncbi:repetitive proline-rich cell wall protein-like [Iris pallida]|uniref:Repetitive proline-rich cell wall protein-like n=1 Tax=Iris pallida TaxID=29817 RepID=A0AAX6I209_IRIPA|nr:repetitive proline-rich cell wall protein-like [Iris pallida]